MDPTFLLFFVQRSAKILITRLRLKHTKIDIFSNKVTKYLVKLMKEDQVVISFRDISETLKWLVSCVTRYNTLS